MAKTNLTKLEKRIPYYVGNDKDGDLFAIKRKERNDLIRTIRACKKFLRTRERQDEVRLISSLSSFDWKNEDT